MRLLPFIPLCLLGLTLPARATIIYVNPSAAGSLHNGVSWATAFTTIQDSVAAATSGDEIWVAAGTYSAPLPFAASVSLYGGFQGAETSRTQRDWTTHRTVISGIEAQVPTGVAVLIDGFTLQQSDLSSQGTSLVVANSIFQNTSIAQTGGSLTVTASTLTGSAHPVYAVSADVHVTGNTISDSHVVVLAHSIGNSATVHHGAVYLIRCSGEVTGNTIENNSTSVGLLLGEVGPIYGGGAGLYAAGCTLFITGNAIIGNSTAFHGTSGYPTGAGILASGGQIYVRDNLITGNTLTVGDPAGLGLGPGTALGAGVYLSGGSFVVENNTISGNSAAVANPAADALVGGLYVATTLSAQTTCTAHNNIVAFNTGGIGWNGTAPTWGYNDVFGNGQDYPTAGPNLTGMDTNIAVDPLFVDRNRGDFHLLPLSPCVDAGDDTAVGEMHDLDGRFRVQGAHVDIGAYEIPTGGQLTIADAGRALRLASGLAVADSRDMSRLDVSFPIRRVDLVDVVSLARKAAGLDTNP